MGMYLLVIWEIFEFLDLCINRGIFFFFWMYFWVVENLVKIKLLKGYDMILNGVCGMFIM